MLDHHLSSTPAGTWRWHGCPCYRTSPHRVSIARGTGVQGGRKQPLCLTTVGREPGFDHTRIGTVSSGAGQPAGWRLIGFGRASQHARLRIQHSARGGMEYTEGEGETPATEAVMCRHGKGRRVLTIPESVRSALGLASLLAGDLLDLEGQVSMLG
jgi:hypothetical protein